MEGKLDKVTSVVSFILSPTPAELSKMPLWKPFENLKKIQTPIQLLNRLQHTGCPVPQLQAEGKLPTRQS